MERKLQDLHGALYVSLPREFAEEHSLEKGSVVRVWYNGDVMIEAMKGAPAKKGAKP